MMTFSETGDSDVAPEAPKEEIKEVGEKKVEALEFAEEAKRVDQATYEPEAAVERVGDYKEAEATQTALVKVIEAQATTAESVQPTPPPESSESGDKIPPKPPASTSVEGDAESDEGYSDTTKEDEAMQTAADADTRSSSGNGGGSDSIDSPSKSVYDSESREIDSTQRRGDDSETDTTGITFTVEDSEGSKSDDSGVPYTLGKSEGERESYTLSSAGKVEVGFDDSEGTSATDGGPPEPGDSDVVRPSAPPTSLTLDEALALFKLEESPTLDDIAASIEPPLDSDDGVVSKPETDGAAPEPDELGDPDDLKQSRERKDDTETLEEAAAEAVNDAEAAATKAEHLAAAAERAAEVATKAEAAAEAADDLYHDLLTSAIQADMLGGQTLEDAQEDMDRIKAEAGVDEAAAEAEAKAAAAEEAREAAKAAAAEAAAAEQAARDAVAKALGEEPRT